MLALKPKARFLKTIRDWDWDDLCFNNKILSNLYLWNSESVVVALYCNGATFPAVSTWGQEYLIIQMMKSFFFFFLKLTNMFVEVQITEALSLIKEIINFFYFFIFGNNYWIDWFVIQQLSFGWQQSHTVGFPSLHTVLACLAFVHEGSRLTRNI